MEISEIKFAKSGDVNIAYQRYGSGPDVVIIPGLVSNVELSWEQEVYRRAREHCGKYVRVLEFDKRGIGSSDRFEQMHPERVDRLVLATSAVGPSAYGRLAEYAKEPVLSVEQVFGRLEHLVSTWAREPEVFVDLFSPSLKGDASFLRWAARFQRQTASPAATSSANWRVSSCSTRVTAWLISKPRRLSSMFSAIASFHLHRAVFSPTRFRTRRISRQRCMTFCGAGGVAFEDRGEHTFKGIDGPWRLSQLAQ
jgi:pimeloyl-ACP methyl ester carboxylesterase